MKLTSTIAVGSMLLTLMQPSFVIAQEVDMTDLGSITIPAAHADGNALGPGVIDPQGEYLLIGSGTSGRIFKVQVKDPSTGNPKVEVVESVDIPSVSNYSVALMDPSGLYAYFGTNTAPARVVRVRVDDLAFEVLVLEEGNDKLRAGIIDSDGSHVYFGTGTSPGKIVKIQVPVMTHLTTLILQSNEVEVRAAAYNPVHNHAYFALNTTQGIVVRVNLANFTRVEVTTFSYNAGPAHAAVFSDTLTPSVYFGLWSAPGKVVRFTASPYAENISGNIVLPDGEFFIRSAVTNTGGQYAYFLTGTTSARVIKVDLGSIARVGSLTLDMTNNTAPHIVIDPAGSYLYTSTGPDSLTRIALSAAAYDAAQAVPEPTPEPPPEEPSLFPTGFASGDLVTLPDDGNVETYGDAAVYYLGADGKRYVFPNDRIYFSWYEDFSTVKMIDADSLASFSLGGNVTYRPGVKMLKLQSSPKVYVVAAGGELREVPSEEIAAALYGTDWNQNIDDLSDAFWTHYTLGNPLVSAEDFDPTAARDISTTINLNLSL